MKLENSIWNSELLKQAVKTVPDKMQTSFVKFFVDPKTHYGFRCMKKSIFYYKKYSALSGSEKFSKINNTKLRELKDF